MNEEAVKKRSRNTPLFSASCCMFGTGRDEAWYNVWNNVSQITMPDRLPVFPIA